MGLGLDRASIACYVIGVLGVIALLLAERRDEGRGAPPAEAVPQHDVLGGRLGRLRAHRRRRCSAASPRCRCTCRSSRAPTPTEAGLLLLPMTLGIMFGSILSGQIISRTGRYRMFPIIGSALLAIALFVFHYVECGHPAVADHDRHGRRSGWGWASTSSRSPWPCRTRCRRGRSASPPRRRPSPARSVARSAPPCSCRSCSPRRARRSPRPCRPPSRPPTSRPRWPTRRTPPCAEQLKAAQAGGGGGADRGAPGQLVPQRPRRAHREAVPHGLLRGDGHRVPRRLGRHGRRLPRDADAAARRAAQGSSYDDRAKAESDAGCEADAPMVAPH